MPKQDTDRWINVSEDIGGLKKGLDNLTTHFTNHLSDHKIDRLLHWGTLSLQVIIIMVLGYFNIN